MVIASLALLMSAQAQGYPPGLFSMRRGPAGYFPNEEPMKTYDMPEVCQDAAELGILDEGMFQIIKGLGGKISKDFKDPKTVKRRVVSSLGVPVNFEMIMGAYKHDMIPAGSALITPAGALEDKDIDYIIHAAPTTMGRTPAGFGATEQSLVNSIRNSIELARTNDVDKVAIPCVGCGIFLDRLAPMGKTAALIRAENRLDDESVKLETFMEEKGEYVVAQGLVKEEEEEEEEEIISDEEEEGFASESVGEDEGMGYDSWISFDDLPDGMGGGFFGKEEDPVEVAIRENFGPQLEALENKVEKAEEVVAAEEFKIYQAQVAKVAEILVQAAAEYSDAKTKVVFVGYNKNPDEAMALRSAIVKLKPEHVEFKMGNLMDGRVHGARAIVNAANAEVTFGGGLAAAIGGASGARMEINQYAAETIETRNELLIRSLLEGRLE